VDLEHLIYVSTATVELADRDLDAILDVSARRNADAAVTGMLLYGGGCFMQVLEGPRDAVESTFARVAHDDRHYGVVVVGRGAAAHRDFAQWSMGFRRVEELAVGQRPSFTPLFTNGFDVSAIAAKPGLALDLLREFAHLQTEIEGR
jgi:hypothetical protein